MAKKKRGLKEEYNLLTRDLDWDPTFVTREEMYPYTDFEGIKIHNWNNLEDPFRVTVESYVRIQGEKERKFHAIRENIDLLQGQLDMTDARWLEAMKIFSSVALNGEYNAHRLFQFIARHVPSPAIRFAAITQSVDELRHVQNEVLLFNNYNKYYQGFHDWKNYAHRHWLTSVVKSFFEDAQSAGPFEALVAIAFGFEVAFTNLLFVTMGATAVANRDQSYGAVSFTTQSDESRHMTLGMMALRAMIEEDPDNIPIVQKFLDKWFWKAYRAFTVVGYILDYIAPKKVMSWKEAYEMYIEDQVLNGLFKDLEVYGIRKPKYWEQTVQEKEHNSHIAALVLYRLPHVLYFHPFAPTEEDKKWLAEKYPESWENIWSKKWEAFEDPNFDRLYPGLPMVCQTCQYPMFFDEPGQPGFNTAFRTSEHEGEVYHFCSDGCKDIFDDEPDKIKQAWLPPHEIFKGTCGPAEDLANYWGMEPEDGGDYYESVDHQNFEKWKKVRA
ncbi:MAG TPA: phenol 2-monooxygenase [Paenibacillaceae bacterium]|nr:phenol 2-monooxygenase [Paenibacillaceae bacterium]